MAFPRNLLTTNEELVLDLRPHWFSLFLPALYVLASVIVGVGLTILIDGDVPKIIAAVLILAALVHFGWKYLVWNSTMFVLTTDRIVSRYGVLSKSGLEIPLERINTVIFEQSVFERMIGSGDLIIESAGERGAQSFSDIRKPSIVKNEIYVQMEANENRKFDRINPNFAAAPAAPDIPAQIEKLSELHQRGVISDAEFQQKKADLLDRM